MPCYRCCMSSWLRETLNRRNLGPLPTHLEARSTHGRSEERANRQSEEGKKEKKTGSAHDGCTFHRLLAWLVGKGTNRTRMPNHSWYWNNLFKGSRGTNLSYPRMNRIGIIRRLYSHPFPPFTALKSREKERNGAKKTNEHVGSAQSAMFSSISGRTKQDFVLLLIVNEEESDFCQATLLDAEDIRASWNGASTGHKIIVCRI